MTSLSSWALVEPMLTHISAPYGVTSLQWVNKKVSITSLWPSDAIWRHRSESTLVQVMACCLSAASHYLNQRWLISSEVLWHSTQSNFPESDWANILYIEFKNYVVRDLYPAEPIPVIFVLYASIPCNCEFSSKIEFWFILWIHPRLCGEFMYAKLKIVLS